MFLICYVCILKLAVLLIREGFHIELFYVVIFLTSNNILVFKFKGIIIFG